MISKIVKVSGKGQIAIPVEIRRSMSIEQNDSLLLVQSGERIIVEKPRHEDDFSGLNSDSIAKELWDNKEDEVWNDA